MKYIQFGINLIITAALWCFFTVGFVLIFSVPAFIVYFCSINREKSFQLIIHLFYRLFFAWLTFIAPKVTIYVSPQVRRIDSAVIVANHISYLDPLLMIFLYPRHKTIVKSRFFTIPVFGRVISACGYIPSSLYEIFSPAVIKQVKSLRAFLSSGGNLFIFPEGVRNTDGRIGELNAGAFRLAKKHKAMIAVIRINGTDRLFPPHHLLFRVDEPVRITVELAGKIAIQHEQGTLSVMELINRTRYLLEARQGQI